MRSDEVKKGHSRAPHRSLFRATGLKDEDFDKPFIGVANSFIEIIPGHFFLDKVSAIIKEEIRANGCVPFEFNTIGVDDGNYIKLFSKLFKFVKCNVNIYNCWFICSRCVKTIYFR